MCSLETSSEETDVVSFQEVPFIRGLLETKPQPHVYPTHPPGTTSNHMEITNAGTSIL